MLSRALKMAFWVMYDHLGKLVLANLVWALLVTLPAAAALGTLYTRDPQVILSIGLPLGVLCLGIIAPLLSAGICHMIKVLIDHRDGSFWDMFRGIRLYWRKAIAIGLLYLFALVCLATSVWFYPRQFGGALPWVGYGLSALALWALVFALLTSMYVLPALVQKKDPVLKTIRLAGLLVLDNPLMSVGLSLQLSALTAVALLLSPVFFFVYGVLVLSIMSSAYEMLSRKYAAVEAAQTLAPTEKAPSEADIFRDETDEYLTRGFRDFLFPWKG